MIIPTIDIMNGKVVKLAQGKNLKIELDIDPIKWAEKFKGFEKVQVIDLDAAMGKGENLEVVKKICGIVNARVGGGIRSVEKAKELIEAGAKKVIIGTMANKKFLGKLAKEIGKERIIVAVETFEGKVVVEGWTKEIEEKMEEKIKEAEPYCSEFLYTNVEREGLMKGVDFDTIKILKNLTDNKLSVAGGISSQEEVDALDKMEVDAVVGIAILEGKIKIEGIEIE